MYIKTYDCLAFVKTQIFQYYGLVKIKHKFTLIFSPKLQKTNLEKKLKHVLKLDSKSPLLSVLSVSTVYKAKDNLVLKISSRNKNNKVL